MAQNPEAPSSAQPQSIQQAVSQLRSASFWAVVQDFTGSFQNVGQFISTFMREFSTQRLDTALLGFNSKAILILHGDPGANAPVQMAVGLTVPGSLVVHPPLRAQQVQFAAAAHYLHVGAHAELGRVHGQIVQALGHGAQLTEAPGRQAAISAVLVLIDDPNRVPANALRTELFVPASQRGPQVPGEAALEMAVPGEAALKMAVPGEAALETAAPSEAAVETVAPSEALAAAVRAPRSVSHLLVAQPFNGSPDQIGAFLNTFMGNFSAQGLGENLSGRDVPLAILHGDTDQQGRMTIDIGFPVKQRLQVREPLVIREFKAERAIVLTHRGHYHELSKVHGDILQKAQAIPEFAERSGGGRVGWPVALRLLTDPHLAKSPADIKTEIIVSAGSGQG